MENNFFIEVTILLLPPLFNRMNFKNDGIYFLGLDEISESKISFFNLNPSQRDDICLFVKNISVKDFSDRVVELIRKKVESCKVNNLKDLKVMMVNYPMSNEQFNSLQDKLQSMNLKVSKMIISNSVSFESLLKIKSRCFICPICFRSYEKDINFIDDKYVCPLDKEKFDPSQMNLFINFFTEHYLNNSVEVIQNFASKENSSKNMFALNIDNENEVEGNLVRILKCYHLEK